MFSGKSSTIPMSEVIVAPDRQRRELKGIEELASSIRQVGLINPIVVTPDNVLVAGERRFRAHELLGHTHIEVRYTTDLPRQELERIELEENLKRADLSWQEECLGVARYFDMLRAENPDTTLEDASTALSISPTQISIRTNLAALLRAGEPLIVGADSITVAKNAMLRLQQRAGDAAAAAIEAAFGGADEEIDEAIAADALTPSTVAATVSRAVASAVAPRQETSGTAAVEATKPAPVALPAGPIFHADFHDFAADYSGLPFNFLHCDFPYGINADKHNQGAASKFGGYSDTADVYFTLLETLAEFTQRGVAESAHMMFWLAPKFLRETETLLRDAGWTINPYPLIWHRSDNSGIIPDPKRSGRQVYEMCLHCTRGDRFVAQSVANLVSHPQAKEIHTSEKPRPMLAHFFRMFVDSSTRMLDPTAGSGNAIAVGLRMGASVAVGLERDEEYVRRGLAMLQKTGNETY